MIAEPVPEAYSAIALAVAHSHYREIGIAGIKQWGNGVPVIYDLKQLLPENEVQARL